MKREDAKDVIKEHGKEERKKKRKKEGYVNYLRKRNNGEMRQKDPNTKI